MHKFFLGASFLPTLDNLSPFAHQDNHPLQQQNCETTLTSAENTCDTPLDTAESSPIVEAKQSKYLKCINAHNQLLRSADKSLEL